MEPGELFISCMRDQDLAEVIALDQTVLPAWSRPQFEEEMLQPSSSQYIVRRPGVSGILAYICCRLVAGEAEILKLVVAAEVRRKKVGTALLQFALEKLRQQGAAACFLELRTSNRAARKLYEKAGFLQMGSRKGYYANPAEDAVLMGRRLAEGV